MRRLIKVLIAVVLGSAAHFAHAYMYSQVGVDSNLLPEGGHVVFAQSDGSLTMLALDTGQVLRREKSHYFSGDLKRVSPGILVLQYDSIALLNPTNLTTIWETKTSYKPNVIGNTLVSYDGNGLVENRNLADGKVRWTYALPGALDVIAEKGTVLVHRAATYEAEHVPTTVLLDLESGKELFRKIPPPGIHWPAVFYDGNSVYVEQGSFEGKRSDYKIERLLVLNRFGEEVRTIPISADSGNNLRWDNTPFDLDQKTFYDGRVYSNRWSIPRERFGFPAPPVGPTNESSESAYDLGRGFLLVEREKNLNGHEHRMAEIEVRSPEGSWTAELPYLSGRGQISAIALASGRILVGSDLGHVECLNATNGESLWMYVFPTMRETMSYSSFGMPPMMSQAATIFRSENEHPPTSGSRLQNQPARPTRIILDPEPANPFKKLPFLLTIVWSAALIPLLLLVCLHAYSRTRQQNLGPISILLVLIVFGCFMSYGRVSPGSSIALRITMLTGIALGLLDAVKCFRRGKWLVGATIVGLSLGIMVLIVPFLLRI